MKKTGKLIRSTIGFVILLMGGMQGCNSQVKEHSKEEEKSLSQILEGGHFDQQRINLLIDKSDYKMYVRINTQVIKEYPVVFGKSTTDDDKLMQGDRSTPEGKFTMIAKYPHAQWSKFIWINYPTKESWQKHNAAKAQNKIPAKAAIGGEIGIHGVPDDRDDIIDARYNWTLGCISMKNKDVNELYPYMTKATVIEIRK